MMKISPAYDTMVVCRTFLRNRPCKRLMCLHGQAFAGRSGAQARKAGIISRRGKEGGRRDEI